ncbi:hypothetical protein MBLNU230_g0814t1 [Neophaeotheca triangularis]
MSIFDTNAPAQQGARATETAHRKIELQAPADLTYLIAKVSRTAEEKLDKHLPPDAVAQKEKQSDESGKAGGEGVEEDEMRKRVRGLVEEYIHDTFAAAKDSIAINGMDARELEAELDKAQQGEEIETFDAKLAQRIQSLSAQIEAQTLQLANLRRTAPAETAGKFETAVRGREAEDERVLREREELGLEEAGAVEVDVGRVERLDEVRASYEGGAKRLRELEEGGEGTVRKMRRARKAVEFVEEGK